MYRCCAGEYWLSRNWACSRQQPLEQHDPELLPLRPLHGQKRLRSPVRQGDGEGIGIEGQHAEAAHRRGKLVLAGAPNSAGPQAVTGPAESPA
jgi:hypothetical protein